MFFNTSSEEEVASQSDDGGGIALPKNFESNPELKEKSRELRKNMTFEENRLWYHFLRKYDVRFSRQRIIGNYIVDFYCRKANLAIEIDGSQHYTHDAIEYDKNRTEYLRNCGIEVLRFLNKDIKCDFENVCAYIDKIVKQRLG